MTHLSYSLDILKDIHQTLGIIITPQAYPIFYRNLIFNNFTKLQVSVDSIATKSKNTNLNSDYRQNPHILICTKSFLNYVKGYAS